MNIAEPFALYLSLWRSINGPNTPVHFPGTKESYTHLHSNVSSKQLGRFHVYVSLHPELTAGKAFNIADQDLGNSWEMIWGGIASYFGLVGIGPLEESGKGKGQLSGEAWVSSHRDKWEAWEVENGLRPKVLEKTCWGFMSIVA